MTARVVPLAEIKEESEGLGKRVNDFINLINHGFEVADSFIITHKAFLDFLKENNLENKVKHLLSLGLQHAIDKHLKQSKLPKDLTSEILKEYKKFGTVLENADVNVFLSHFSDSPTQKVGGDAELLEKIKSFWTSSANNSTLIVQKIHFGKHGKLRTSSNFINTIHSLTRDEIMALENMVSKFKKIFYLPHEIHFTLERNKVLISKINPETHIALHDITDPETHYKVIGNSHY